MGDTINLIGIGDSLTEGVGGSDGQNTCWLSQLLPMLDSSNITIEDSGRTRHGKKWTTLNMGKDSH
jgi:hypothetical protein